LSKRAILLIGHGSRVKGAASAMKQTTSVLCKRNPGLVVQTAFLEINTPNIPDGLEQLVNEEATEIIVVPYFVQTGRHVLEDVPKIISAFQLEHPRCAIHLAKHLGFDERIVSVIEDRIKEAGTTSL
jgi:sirohydrochlorin ferrochelatase